MSPGWRTPLHKLLQKPHTPLRANSASKSTSTQSLTSSPSPASDQPMATPEPENTSTHLDASAAPRIFALVVAIDRYKTPELDPLSGCKHDGQRFIRFLTGVLGVPSAHIAFLADEDATQAAILTRFDEFLIRNADIRRDDAIVFYFAGHGTQLDAPPGWVTDNGKVEVLCPHDVQTVGDDGEELWGISDRAIDALMRHLAFEKGDNIIAVFDCCHSGGLSRAQDAHAGGLRIRSIPPPPRPPPADLNRDIWAPVPETCARGAQTVIQTGFRCKAMSSHVLLAACRPDEPALEDPSAKDAPGGLFTAALIDGLRRRSLHDTSYARLFEMLNLRHKTPHQHPQCEGINTDRLLFSVNTLRNGETTFRVSEKKGKLYVSAGSIHGIAEGTEFAIRTSTQRLVLKAKKVSAFETVLGRTPLHVTGSDAEATVSQWHHPTLRMHSSFRHASTHVTVVPTDEPADVALYPVESGKWELKRCDPLIPVYSDRFVRIDADARRMRDILDAVANFNSCLYRSGGAAASFAGKVKMRMNRIGVVQGEINPVGDDLLDVPRTSHSGVVVKEAMITDLESRYSFTLENTSEVDLFPYFFCFDPSDYSIQPWYKSQSSTTPAPLKRAKPDGTPSLFAFGYGGFGTDPVEFFLPPGSKMDSVFLKVFLTTTYVDMNNVAQVSVGEVSSSRGLRSNLKGTWTCETFVLTCRKV